jgi:hypothetical protein
MVTKTPMEDPRLLAAKLFGLPNRLEPNGPDAIQLIANHLGPSLSGGMEWSVKIAFAQHSGLLPKNDPTLLKARRDIYTAVAERFNARKQVFPRGKANELIAQLRAHGVTPHAVVERIVGQQRRKFSAVR